MSRGKERYKGQVWWEWTLKIVCCLQPPHAVCGEEMCELVEGVLEEVTGEGWRGRGGGGGGEEGGESTPASATLLQCLQLQVVDVCVRLLRASFLPHLQTQAYLLLARAGSPLPEVSSLALSTLTTVASCTEERWVWGEVGVGRGGQLSLHDMATAYVWMTVVL